MKEELIRGRIIKVNGPIVEVGGLARISMFDIAQVGPLKILGEVIRLQRDVAFIQVYEDNMGLKAGDEVVSAGRPLSVLLGPGLIGGIYDGIQRSLVDFAARSGNFIERGVTADRLPADRAWPFEPLVRVGDSLTGGAVVGRVQEGSVIHRVLLPPGEQGVVEKIVPAGDYRVDETIYVLKGGRSSFEGKLAHFWPVRKARPVKERKRPQEPLVTGQRIIDTFFPVARGGTAAIPGGFGTGKTMTQHALAKWSDADIIVYIGCGERGNEMAEVLKEFPALVDERTGRALMERTIMIANTSNMPVPAREVSIYTGVTIAEYYRDMGYNVAVMADSTSRWAEALRELSSRLGDMPAEGGFPPYLATRLAEFYERSGRVTTLSGEESSVTIIGAVSPPGGDFSEPVTQHTSRFVRCFWALDKALADARHYPSISWIDSYTEYLDDIKEWWHKQDDQWSDLRGEAMKVLLEDNRLQQVVRLVGPEALPENERFLLFCAEMIKNAFLQQNAFDKNDRYCSPAKQIKLLKLIISFYKLGRDLIQRGAPLEKVLSIEGVSGIVRLKLEVENQAVHQIDHLREDLERRLGALGEELEVVHAGRPGIH